MAQPAKLSYNLDHNILELYNVLVQIQLTTSKTKRDIYYTKLGIRVALRVFFRIVNSFQSLTISQKSPTANARLGPKYAPGYYNNLFS